MIENVFRDIFGERNIPIEILKLDREYFESDLLSEKSLIRRMQDNMKRARTAKEGKQ